MNISKRFEGCIIGGAIGDAFGSGVENSIEKNDDNVCYLFGKPARKIPDWNITDDTQLTLATCDVIIENKEIKTEKFAEKFLEYYKQKKISGIGSSTLKALIELEAGGHWSQVGRRGEYAAGNGAAMRIAPLAFIDSVTNEQIREISSITHHNDEAYVGALSVVIALKAVINGTWTGRENLLELVIDQIPDTRLRDRLIEINHIATKSTLFEIGKLGSSGYVVDSIPLAIASASRITTSGFEQMCQELIEIGGDTDTNCAIAGQIAGTLVGVEQIPETLLGKMMKLPDYKWIKETVTNMSRKWWIKV